MRIEDELSEFLMDAHGGLAESILAMAMASVTSTDVLGAIAAHESLPESIKTAARSRIQALMGERKRQADDAKERAAASRDDRDEDSSSHYDDEEDYGRGRYCAGCGGC